MLLFVLAVARAWAVEWGLDTLTRGNALLKTGVEFLANVRLLGTLEISLMLLNRVVEALDCLTHRLFHQVSGELCRAEMERHTNLTADLIAIFGLTFNALKLLESSLAVTLRS